MASVGDLLQPIEPHLAPALMTRRHLSEIRAVTDHLPLALTSLVGFELRLGDPSAAVDLLIHVAPEGREVLAGLDTAPGSATIRGGDVWKRIRDVARAWSVPASALDQRLLAIWLEFDLPLPTDATATPFVFLSLREEAWVARGGSLSWWLDGVMPTLLGERVPPATRRLLKQCIDDLPAGAAVSDIGLALNRQPTAIRLNVTALSQTDLVPYLQRIGWPGAPEDFANIDRLLTPLRALVAPVQVCIDVTETVGARLGLECSPSLERAFAGDGVALLLEFLVQRGLCHPDIVTALPSYVGVTSAGDAVDSWPLALRAASAFMGQRYTSVIRRNVSHVKLSLLPGGAEDAKAYAYAGYAWRQSARSIGPTDHVDAPQQEDIDRDDSLDASDRRRLTTTVNDSED